MKTIPISEVISNLEYYKQANLAVASGTLTGWNSVAYNRPEFVLDIVKEMKYQYALDISDLDSDNTLYFSLAEHENVIPLADAMYMHQLSEGGYYLLFKDADTAFRLRLMIGF